MKYWDKYLDKVDSLKEKGFFTWQDLVELSELGPPPVEERKLPTFEEIRRAIDAYHKTCLDVYIHPMNENVYIPNLDLEKIKIGDYTELIPQIYEHSRFKPCKRIRRGIMKVEHVLYDQNGKPTKVLVRELEKPKK